MHRGCVTDGQEETMCVYHTHTHTHTHAFIYAHTCVHTPQYFLIYLANEAELARREVALLSKGNHRALA